MSRDGRGRTPKTGAAAVAQHGGYMHVNQWRPPLLKPGVPPCVVWSTRMTWVPPGGTPYEARCSSIQTLCTSLVKQHAADLRSAEGTLRFFRKQWSRYEAEGFGALGLPAPRPPQTPLFRLLVPSNSLHVHVRVSLKERAPNQGNVFGMGAGAAGGVTPTLAALHPPTAAASPSSHPNNNNTNNNNSSNNAGQARGGGPTTTATTIGSASKGGGSTTADQNMANPSSSFAIPSGAATTTAGGAGGKKGAAAAAAGPSKGGNHANSNARKSPPQASKRTASTASKQAAAAPAGHTVPRPPPLPSESSSAPPGAATFQPTGPSSGTAQTASGSNAAAFGSAAAVLQYAAKFRRKSDRRASASSPPGATDQNGESLVVSSEQASSTNSPSRRRSVHRSSVYGNDEILDRALQKVGPREEGTLLSPDAYAVILGKPSVAAMRSFVDDRVITSSDGPRPPLLKKQQRGASPISSSRDPNHIGMAKEEQAVDGSSPLLHMKLKSLNQHYTQTALREQADLYHCPAHPKTLLASALDHDDDLQLQVAFPTTSSVAPRHFHRDQTTQKLSTCAVVSGVPVAVAELTSPQRLTALHNAMSLSPVTATTAAGGGGVGLMVMKSPSTHQPSAPTVSGTTTTGFVGLAHSPRRKLLAASTGAGHHASSSGAAVVKLRPHVANDKPMLPSLDVTPHAETARSGARGGWELPPETDLVHDAQLAVAFAGSSEAQRRLMRSGVTIPQPRKVLPLPSSTAAAQTSRVPAIGAVELLEAMDESRRRHASNLQARRML